MEWDAANRIAHVSYVDVHIDCDEAYQAWSDRLFREFDRVKRVAKGKFALVVCVDELYLSRKVSERYGAELARRVADEYATVIARYGAQRPMTKAVIAVEAMRRSLASPTDDLRLHGANLFRTRDEAIAFVREGGA
ncbi:MAG: hypothetical protein H6721_24555 [Sandaracinus sp.]|nr:hypothetical protein [Sandaracinus sp.]